MNLVRPAMREHYLQKAADFDDKGGRLIFERDASDDGTVKLTRFADLFQSGAA